MVCKRWNIYYSLVILHFCKIKINCSFQLETVVEVNSIQDIFRKNYFIFIIKNKFYSIKKTKKNAILKIFKGIDFWYIEDCNFCI
jgi:hypothetical protein